MSYYDDEDDSKAEAQAAQELLAEGWQPHPRGNHRPAGGLPAGRLLTGPPRRSCSPAGDDGSWWTYGYAHFFDGELHGLELEDDGSNLAGAARSARTWKRYPRRKLWKPPRKR